MEEITYFDQEQQHLFSYADEIYDFQNIDGPSDFGSDNSDSYNDRISPPLDQVCIPYYDIDTKWRSVSVGNPSQLLSRSDEIHNDVANRGLTAPVDLKSTPKRPSNIYRIQVSAGEEHYTCNENTDDVARKQALDIKVPEEPYLLFLSHFETCVPFHRVSDLIERTFDQFPEISFEFVAGECVWNAVYLRGSSHCKIQVNVYTRGSSHIVEGNRLSGDGAAFRAVFNALKDTIQTAYSDAKCPDCIAITFPAPLHDLSDVDSHDALKPVLLMAKSGKVESQLSASRMICDLSLHDDMQQLLCDSGCLQSLVEDLLPLKNCEWTHQHALIALANLSEAQSCQGAMIDAGVLPALLALATDGPYQSAEVSRESARILANLSSCMATKVVHVLGPGAVLNWIGSVDLLRDERLKLHASRAKEFLIVAAV